MLVLREGISYFEKLMTSQLIKGKKPAYIYADVPIESPPKSSQVPKNRSISHQRFLEPVQPMISFTKYMSIIYIYTYISISIHVLLYICKLPKKSQGVLIVFSPPPPRLTPWVLVVFHFT